MLNLSSRMKQCCKVLAVLVPIHLPLLLSASEHIEQLEGYRMTDFDAPVPEALDGATVVNAVEVKQLMEEQQALIVDVIPEQRRPDFLPENQIWIPVPHHGVSGALWLPDVGYGELSEVTERYFKQHLEQATGGKWDYPIVFYCRTNCWMSWNAAKHALLYGYTRVFWFADGIEDWAFEGFDFAVLTPAAGQRQVQ